MRRGRVWNRLCWMDPPATRYVTVGDAQVAYQVVGDGPLDLLWCYGAGAQIDLVWLDPRSNRFLAGLAAFSRLILFDGRGAGASDASGSFPTWEKLAEDIEAVLEAAHSKQTAIMANLDAGPIALLYAAMHPERVIALVLRNTTARVLHADDYPIGRSVEDVAAICETLATLWGSEDMARLGNPSLADDAEFIRWCALINRASATPRAMAAQMEYFQLHVDVRSALALITTPTLVIHAQDNAFMPITMGRYLADHIAGASLIEVPGADLGQLGDDETVADIAEFLTGERPPVDVDRILTTVLFTDIVGSTERAGSLGDHRWRQLLDAHDRIVREQLRRHRGREINTTGDGFVISFDGPARAIRCARAIVDATSTLGVAVRAGLHTGECEIRGDDLSGLAVHIAARVSAMARAREIVVSSTVKDLVAGSDIQFTERGEHELKGVPGPWKLFAVQS